jgi:DNA-directed RNA polymerase specialized sigma24 family protein
MREQVQPHPFLLNAVDRLGRPIQRCVLSVAQDIAPQAVCYAQKFLADPCVAMNLLEEATATVSEAVLAKQATELPPIRDLRAYLYRAFLRRVSAQRQAEIRLEEAFEDHFRLNEGMSYEEKLEARLLLKQILCMCDRKTMWIIWERIEGRSWDEIAYDMVMSNHAARLRYSRALREIREAVETNPRAYTEKLWQAERERRRKARLIILFEKVFALLLFRAVRAHSVFGVRFRVTYHKWEEMLADVDNMFS